MISKQERREDLITIPAHQRRLDSFANLVEIFSGSTCIAICVINKQMVLTSNDLYEGSKGRTIGSESLQEIAIKEIYEYFHKIATTGMLPDESERRLFFKRICQRAKYQSSATPFFDLLDSEDAEKLIDAVLHPNRLESITYLNTVKGTVPSSAKGSWEEVSKSFRKLEETLVNKNPIKITDEYIEAFKNQPHILKAEKEPGVHAEVQILAELYRQRESLQPNNIGDGDFYIGISKLCCLNCEVMLDAANQINTQKEHYFSVKFRGEHDLKCEGWKPPKALKESTLEEVIKLTDSRVKAILLEAKASKISHKADLNHGVSDSSAPRTPPNAESISIVDMLMRPMSEAREALQRCGWKEEEDINSILEIILDLLKIDSFSRMLREQDLDMSAVNMYFQVILRNLREARPDFPEKKLIKILRNEHLVGKRIATQFKDYLSEGSSNKVDLANKSQLESGESMPKKTKVDEDQKQEVQKSSLSNSGKNKPK